MSSSYWNKSQEDWDKSQEEQKPERPKQVLYAVYLIYAQIAISIIILMIAVLNRPPGSYTLGIICAITIALLIPIWPTSRIAAGRNWARILNLVFVILSLFGVIDLVQNVAADPLPWSLAAMSTILGLIAIALLFSGPSRAWFKQNKKRRPAKTEKQKAGAKQKRREVLMPSGVAGLIGSIISAILISMALFFSGYAVEALVVGSCSIMISSVAGPALGVAGGRIGAFATRNTERAFIHRRGQLIGGFIGGLFYVPLYILFIFFIEYTQ